MFNSTTELTKQSRNGSETLVMGVLNVTPDSFSDGGKWQHIDAALQHAKQMWDAGADIIDVGGESTRPGATPVEVEEELKRVIPVVKELASQGMVVSVDTLHAEVAETALLNGASIINDVSGGEADSRMQQVVAQAGCIYVAQHWKGDPASMMQREHYACVNAEVTAHLQKIALNAQMAGVTADKIVLDPGIGFGKNIFHDWTLLANLPSLNQNLGLPILVGASRKRSMLAVVKAWNADTVGVGGSADWVADQMRIRDLVTTATTALAFGAKMWAVRVHDVQSSVNLLIELAQKETNDI